MSDQSQKVERMRELLSDLTGRDVHYLTAELVVHALAEAIVERLQIRYEDHGVDIKWTTPYIAVKSADKTPAISP